MVFKLGIIPIDIFHAGFTEPLLVRRRRFRDTLAKVMIPFVASITADPVVDLRFLVVRLLAGRADAFGIFLC